MKQSKFFKTRNITGKLRDMNIGDSIILELQPETTFNSAMGTVTATAAQNNMKVTQKAFRTVSTNETDNIIYRFIRIKRES